LALVAVSTIVRHLPPSPLKSCVTGIFGIFRGSAAGLGLSVSIGAVQMALKAASLRIDEELRRKQAAGSAADVNLAASSAPSPKG
jgi:hypothetical protein